jgi:thiol-disulfide isomerase/thioredoxin
MYTTRLIHSLVLVLALAAHPALALEAGDPAPAFTLPGLRVTDAGSATLDAFRGKVVYVDFWASWCAPCLISIPLLNELRERLVAQGAAFEVLAVNVDSDPEDGIEFLLDEPVNYVVLSDPAGATPAQYQVKGMPTSFLLDRNGRIQLIHEGFKRSDIEMIETHIRQLLETPR